jgi:RNA polymerase subunit RPABC4/transcription elongation factor Spt4
LKCEACGAMNPEGMKFCGNCGKPLGAPQPPAEARSRVCVGCGRPIPWDASICMYCGYDYRPKVKKGTEGQLMTGAILTLLAGFLGIAILLIVYAEGGTFNPGAIFWLSFACCILGIVGGFAALMRRWFPLAVLGAAAALFNPAFFLAIPGLILISSSAARFKDYAPETT